MRTFLTALAVILVLLDANAQVREPAPLQIFLRSNILSPVETDANVGLGLGVQWNTRWAVIVDAAYVFATNPFGGNTGTAVDRDRVRGSKIRTEFRYYFKDVGPGRKTNYYVAPVFHYKKVNAERSQEFGINCDNGDCEYFQIATYSCIKRELGGLLTVGSVSPLFGGNRLAIETFIGLGIKVKKFRETGYPAGATVFESESDVFSINRDGTYPMLPLGCKLTFRIF